jgi:Na+/proline symporter
LLWIGCCLIISAIILGIGQKKMNKEGAAAGMVVGFIDAFLHAKNSNSPF